MFFFTQVTDDFIKLRIKRIFAGAHPHAVHWNDLANHFNLSQTEAIDILRIAVTMGAVQVTIIG